MQVQLPSEADIRKFMPSDTEYVTPLAWACQHDAAVQSQASSAESAQQPAGDNQTQSGPVETAAEKHGKQLDQKIVFREQENLTRLQARFTEYSTKVKCPYKDSLS